MHTIRLTVWGRSNHWEINEALANERHFNKIKVFLMVHLNFHSTISTKAFSYRKAFSKIKVLLFGFQNHLFSQRNRILLTLNPISFLLLKFFNLHFYSQEQTPCRECSLRKLRKGLWSSNRIKFNCPLQHSQYLTPSGISLCDFASVCQHRNHLWTEVALSFRT